MAVSMYLVTAIRLWVLGQLLCMKQQLWVTLISEQTCHLAMPFNRSLEREALILNKPLYLLYAVSILVA